MEGEILDDDIARNSAPSYHDAARHSLTIKQAAELFAQLGVPRSKRSVQRFCEQGHLARVRIKGARGVQFFINREAAARYAAELRHIEPIAAISVAARQNDPEPAVACNSSPCRPTVRQLGTEAT